MPAPSSEDRRDVFVAVLKRLRPLRGVPVWARYLVTTTIVLICFATRYALDEFYPYPYLPFLPGIVIASFVFDRGSGFLATFLSAGLALYFFVEPRNTFALTDTGGLLSGLIFTVVGLLTAALIEALRLTVDELTASTERLAARERELSEGLGLLEAVIEGTPDPIFVKDLESRFVRVNSAMARILGAPRHAILGRRIRDLLSPEQADKIESVDRVVMDTSSPLVVEEAITVAGLGPRRFLSTKAPWYGPDGRVIGLIGIRRDIEERKRAEDDMRAANAQKEVLLHDINHRVKNHLQSVIAMLSMSRRSIKDEAAAEALDATSNRLAVLARVYDRLQLRDAGSAVVNARDSIESLCAEIGPALIGLRPIALRVSAEDAEIDVSRAVSLGLIINEAVTNSLKYAFPEERAGDVIVRFRRDHESFHLEVEDNGVGLSGQATKTGMGTRLIRALAQQLGGTVEWRGPPGTTVAVTFPREPPG